MTVPYAAGALYSTVMDMQRWDEALSGESLAPAAMMTRFFTPIATTTDQVDMGYAYGIYVGTERGRSMQSHDGGINGFATYFSRYPDDDLSVVFLTNREQGGNFYVLARIIADLVLGPPTSP